MYRLKLDSLRNLMRMKGIDIYYIPTADYHESEYVIDYFKARAYMTGFTGSAGVAVVTMKEAGLWTDGRYFIQAEKQIRGTGFELYRMGNEGVLTVQEFMQEKLPDGGCIGFDGRVVNDRDGEAFRAIAAAKKGRLETGEDLVGQIWTDRPALASGPAFYLDEKYSGETPDSKLTRIRACMEKEGAKYHIVSSLDDIAWILNVRGSDIPHVPVILSYLVIGSERVLWFVDESCLDETIKSRMAACGVETQPYDEIYAWASGVAGGTSILLDRGTVNYRILMSLPSDAVIIDRENPAVEMKAVKNPVEIENIRHAHIIDGVAVTKFMYWLKKKIGTEPITELSASDYLESLRASQDGYRELSFTTISAYGANAAMMHYAPTPDSNAALAPKGFLLVDSGGHYMTGSTDITRTFALGELTPDEKKFFTLVAKGNLNLANAKFLAGCTGLNLDILARGPVWQHAVDYQCGTGHGVGYMLCVHEKPNGIRWRPRKGSNCELKEGMVTTDEPGIYAEGRFGIRTENELLCVKAEKNVYGQFLQFENLTYAPIDLDAIDPAYLNEDDKKQLNRYHETVYRTLAPYLTPDECEWLKEYTRAI